MATLGDLDGDGVTELLVGGPDHNGLTTDEGAVYVLFLDTAGKVKSQKRIASNSGGFNGVIGENDRFGTSVTSLGDIDGDGYTDIAVGAPQDDDGLVDMGAYYVLFLDSTGTVISYQKISSTSGSFDGKLIKWGMFGCSLANIGDINDDGINDLAVGERAASDAGNEAGAVWIMYMDKDGTIIKHRKITTNQQGFTGVLSSGDHFGNSVSNIGDIDGNGAIDLLVGAPHTNDGGPDKGAVYILFLEKPDSVITTIKNGNWSDTLTWSCNCVPKMTDTVNINHNVTLTDTLHIYGTLNIKSSIEFTLTSGQLIVEPDGEIINDGLLDVKELINQGTIINNDSIFVFVDLVNDKWRNLQLRLN